MKKQPLSSPEIRARLQQAYDEIVQPGTLYCAVPGCGHGAQVQYRIIRTQQMEGYTVNIYAPHFEMPPAGWICPCHESQ